MPQSRPGELCSKAAQFFRTAFGNKGSLCIGALLVVTLIGWSALLIELMADKLATAVIHFARVQTPRELVVVASGLVLVALAAFMLKRTGRLGVHRTVASGLVAMILAELHLASCLIPLLQPLSMALAPSMMTVAILNFVIKITHSRMNQISRFTSAAPRTLDKNQTEQLVCSTSNHQSPIRH